MKRQASESLKKEIASQDPKNKDKKTVPLLGGYISNISNYDPSKEKSLDRAYFRQEVVELSKSLLGKVIVHQTEKHGTLRAVIVQTEAYKAPLDKGCHAYNNKKTEKTKYFWLDGGHLYIYTIYMPTNICLNVVAGLEGEPEAVLIRAVQPVGGIQEIQKLRDIKSNKLQDLSNGPGKCGQCLGVNKETMNGCDLLEGKLRVVDAGIKNFKMGVSRRVNIDYAEEWVDKPWRFYIEGNSYVSKVNFNAPKKPTKKKK